MLGFTMNFLSVDSYICLDKLAESLTESEEGGWIKFASDDGAIYLTVGAYGERGDLEKTMDLIELYGLKLVDSSDTEIARRYNEYVASYDVDYLNFIKYKICTSEQWARLSEWLRKGNFFSISKKVFSFDDLTDGVRFINKFIFLLTLEWAEGEENIVVSDDEGLDYIEELYLLIIES